MGRGLSQRVRHRLTCATVKSRHGDLVYDPWGRTLKRVRPWPSGNHRVVRPRRFKQAQRSGKASPWLAALLKRKSPKLAAVALANKTARIAWKMMLTGETYSVKSAAAALAGAV
jgi:hypothetical protein